MKKVLLALCKMPGNYYPISPKYINENINDDYMNIKQIDDYTKNHNIHTLKIDLLNKKAITEEDLKYDFVIIVNRKNHLSYGICYQMDKEYLELDKIKSFILNTDKQNRNQIKNIFNNYKDKSIHLANFLNIINNVDNNSINQLNLLEYEELRNIGMYIAHNLIKERRW